MTRPRILVLADVPGWAWHRKAQAYVQHLQDEFDVTMAFHADHANYPQFDLVHLFEVSQIGHIMSYGPLGRRPFKVVAGLTANVWRTWGATAMRRWALEVDALHGNSRLIAADLLKFHERVYYTPNGVDPTIFKRAEPRGSMPLVFGHVGKPNPRKGGDLIITAAQQAKLPLRLIQRTSKLALPQAQMVDWYQGISVVVTASNMDGTPNPMLEGAACECALLSTPIGNMPEFIKTGVNGVLLLNSLPYDANAIRGPMSDGPDPAIEWDPAIIERRRRDLLADLTEAMVNFARHPELTWKMGANARETVLTEWTWQHQVRHVATMWREVLGS